MQYDLSSDFQRKAFLAKAENLLERGAVVELTERAIRTRNQNNYLHLLIGVVAMETGNTIADVKDWYFKRLCNRDLFITTKTDKFAGEVEVVRSSADLTKEEMSIAIDRFKRWGSQNGIYMPNPWDESLLREIAIEMGRNKAYLGG
jgi:hypothetical protein